MTDSPSGSPSPDGRPSIQLIVGQAWVATIAPNAVVIAPRTWPGGRVHEPIPVITNPTTNPTRTVRNWPMPRAVSTANRSCSKPSPRGTDQNGTATTPLRRPIANNRSIATYT